MHELIIMFLLAVAGVICVLQAFNDKIPHPFPCKIGLHVYRISVPPNAIIHKIVCKRCGKKSSVSPMYVIND